ncbi:hypothetical protein [Echinimonas agarilytica]|uniref:Uncharacterized protein n=1 Tax=Echinimonas agarilytica TaxID=1215918 RepID=A0AA41W8C3_9GAMM|nr:hypothetical protein [Echinimonas agarilytica]MCM2680824.1 hypothetical protein [Echinimonas agarilytica]
MQLQLDTYSPIIVPVNWQSELIEDDEQRLSLLRQHFSGIDPLTIKANIWPMGYGSLEHDNLPMLYQPSAIFEFAGLTDEPDVEHAQLYVYDSCLAVLHLRLSLCSDISNIDDLEISNRVEALSFQYLSPVLAQIYDIKTTAPMIQPSAYKFFVNTREELINGKPMWVARMLTKAPNLHEEHYLKWLKNVDVDSDYLLLGSGNSLLVEQKHFSDVNRTMVISQFHAALMNRIEDLLKDNLKQFNNSYYNSDTLDKLAQSINNQQYRNDHIEFIDIQMSAAASGVQGTRRELLKQFGQAWQFGEQRDRITQLTHLTQARLDRLSQDKIRHQNRRIQTLLTFLGALGLISLVVDLIDLEGNTEHEHSTGLLDLIQFSSAEHIINIMFLMVILVTLYFYRNHE